LGRILVVDDEESVCWAFRTLIEGMGYEAAIASTGEDGLAEAASVPPDLVLLDVRLPGMDGLDVLSRMREVHDDVPVIIMTAHGTSQTAIEAMKRGAFEYLLKPVDLDEAELLIARALSAKRLSEEVTRLRDELAIIGGHAHGSLVGNSPAMQDVYKRVGALAPTEASVLITGESGTGKGLIARAIHNNSPRAEGPLVPVSCASLPETLLESELYGHVKGAFTGAVADRVGRAERADGGTLFLDEVGAIPLASQVKLLRFIEERRFERVGSTETIEVDVRIVAATNDDLAAKIADGSFREDLFYRLNAAAIELAPLREREGDVPLLVAHFLQRSDPPAGGVTEEAERALAEYHWPGNVRELENAMAHAAALARGEAISLDRLPKGIIEAIEQRRGGEGLEGAVYARAEARAREIAESGGEGALHDEMLSALTKPVIAAALRVAGGNQVRAAKILGIHRTTLRNRIEEYGL